MFLVKSEPSRKAAHAMLRRSEEVVCLACEHTVLIADARSALNPSGYN